MGEERISDEAAYTKAGTFWEGQVVSCDRAVVVGIVGKRLDMSLVALFAFII